MKSIKRAVSTLLISLFMVSVASAEYTPKVVKLNILERLVIGNMLPKEMSFAAWGIINALRNDLAPTEAEMKALDMKPNPDGEGVIANWDAVSEKEIVFGEIAENLIVDALKKLDSENKLMQEHLTVYEKFVK